MKSEFRMAARVFKGSKQVAILRIEIENGYEKAFVLKTGENIGSGFYNPVLERVFEEMPRKYGRYGARKQPAMYSIDEVASSESVHMTAGRIKENWESGKFPGNWYQTELSKEREEQQ